MVFNTSMRLMKHQFCISIYINSIFRHGIFPFFNGNPFFSEPFGSFLRSMQIRFNIFRWGGGGHATLQKYMVCLTVNASVK